MHRMSMISIMSIKDHQQLAPGQAMLVRDWQNHLVEFARQHRFTLRTMPIIRLHADSSLRTGLVRIEAEMADQQSGRRWWYAYAGAERRTTGAVACTIAARPAITRA